MDFVAILEAGRRDFLDAAAGIIPSQAAIEPRQGAWSVLECIEHVIAVEGRYLNWLSEGTAVTPNRDPEREIRLFTRIRSRLTPVESPEAVRPHGRFRTLSEAVSEFNEVRDRSVELVRERGDGLYAIGMTHPFFGGLNGAEAAQLIDGHARRHADQIREAGEAFLSSRSPHLKPRRRKKPAVFKRDQPDLPSELSEDSVPHWAEGESVVIQEKRLRDINAPDLKFALFQIEGSILERVQLAGSEFGHAIWKDVRFVGCDLANIRAHRLTLVRVEFIDCRLTGFIATALDWQDVLILNGDVRYAQFEEGKFRNCEFEASNWHEADLRKADLTGSVFRSCHLAQADFRGAKLQNTDLRKSEVEGMAVEAGDLKGAIVEPAQAMVFARVLGLQIR